MFLRPFVILLLACGLLMQGLPLMACCCTAKSVAGESAAADEAPAHCPLCAVRANREPAFERRTFDAAGDCEFAHGESCPCCVRKATLQPAFSLHAATLDGVPTQPAEAVVYGPLFERLPEPPVVLRDSGLAELPPGMPLRLWACVWRK